MARCLQDWTWNATLSGAPQGGIVSSVLSNVYLHKLDEFDETVSSRQRTKGVCRKPNPAYEEQDAPFRGRSSIVTGALSGNGVGLVRDPVS